MRGLVYLSRTILSAALAAAVCLDLSSCRSSRQSDAPSVEISRIPAAGPGSPEKIEMIEGRVSGARPDQRIVLFSQFGMWWVQPLANQPFTEIQPDSTWKNWTHPGSSYAALLVDSRFHPRPTIAALPKVGGSVLAVARVAGTNLSTTPKILSFSGYEWELRNSASDRAGSMNFFEEANVFTDHSGLLHLRISKREGHWTSAEVKLSRSLGYGSYAFVVRDVSHLEPAAVLSFFTWDDLPPQREMDIEISRWGELRDKNAQYVIQPYYVPSNTVRFNAPAGTLTHWMIWEPGRASFRTVHGSSLKMEGHPVAEHVFTSGVPSPGTEMVRMNLYVYDSKRMPLQDECEVIIEKFEFRP